MKHIIITISFIIIFSFIPITSYGIDTAIINSQSETLGISSFLEEADTYTNSFFGDTDIKEIFGSAITGKINNNTILKRILSIFGKEVLNCLATLGSVLIIIVIHSVLKSISDNLENKNVSQIIYYVQYILIVAIVMTNFGEIIKLITETINNLVGFTQSLIPILLTLMVTTGNIVTANVIQPILLFLITFIGNIISSFILPLILISITLSIVSNISDKVNIDKLAKYFKSTTIWILGIILTLFVTVLSLEGTLSSTVDGITAKTAKAAVSTVIPVVGKILGDSVDTVIGCASILKNALGVIGVLVIVSICIMPIIKVTILTIMYHLATAVCQPIADEKIVKLLEQIGDTFKILLGVICSMSFILIIGITLAIKITNSGLMYR